jgi:hypothetical protein
MSKTSGITQVPIHAIYHILLHLKNTSDEKKRRSKSIPWQDFSECRQPW